MGEFSNYRQLNIKKVLIAVAIAVLVVVSVTVFIISKVMEKQTKEKMAQENTLITTTQTDTVQAKSKIFTDIDEKISIELPTKYNLTQSYNSEYLIKLSSNENMAVYISRIDKIEGRPLSSVARADRLAYIESYNASSNESELKELSVNGNLAFTYSFHYLDENLKKAFCLQVVLLELDDGIYIFDIDYPLDDLSLYKNLTTEVLTNFIKY